jgi:hypothetical protein
LFIDKFIEYDQKNFELYIWIVDRKSGEKGYGGQINLPFRIDENFMEYVQKIDHIPIRFKGPEINFKQKDYQVILALVDSRTKEIGAMESVVSIPDFKEAEAGSFINCVLGDVASCPQGNEKSFFISNEDGSLECGLIKFYPRVTGEFKQWGGAFLFLQIYLPYGLPESPPEFFIVGKNGQVKILNKELTAESFDDKTLIWNVIYYLDISPASIGENSLMIEIESGKDGSVSNNTIKLNVKK